MNNHFIRIFKQVQKLRKMSNVNHFFTTTQTMNGHVLRVEKLIQKLKITKSFLLFKINKFNGHFKGQTE